MQQEINFYPLLPRAPVSRLNRKNVILIYIALFIFLLALDILMGIGIMQLKKQYTALNTTVQAQQQQLTTLKQAYPVIDLAELDKMLIKLQEEYKNTQMTVNFLLPFARFSTYLLGLAKTDVPGVWLTDIIFDRGDEKIILKGYTLKPAMLEQFYTALTKEPLFKGLLFELNEVKETTIPANFNISASQASPS